VVLSWIWRFGFGLVIPVSWAAGGQETREREKGKFLGLSVSFSRSSTFDFLNFVFIFFFPCFFIFLTFGLRVIYLYFIILQPFVSYSIFLIQFLNTLNKSGLPPPHSKKQPNQLIYKKLYYSTSILRYQSIYSFLYSAA
jgi:hypothetical protein